MRMIWFAYIVVLLFWFFLHENNTSYAQARLPIAKDVFFTVEPILNQPAPSQGYSDNHLGVDISVKEGTDVYPIAQGTVVKIEREGKPLGFGPNQLPISKDPGHGFGNHVIIEHTLPNGEKRYSSYSHLNEASQKIKVGDEVDVRAQLGTVGKTGRSSGPHLHLQIDKELNVLSEVLFPVPPYPTQFTISKLQKPENPLNFIKKYETSMPEVTRKRVNLERVAYQQGRLPEDKAERAARIEKLKKEAAEAQAEAERLASFKGQFKEMLKGIPKAFDDLEHGRLEGTLPQTLYDVNKSLLQTVAAVTPGAFSLSLSDLEKMKKTLDATGSVAFLQSNFNVSESTLASPNFSDNFSAGLGNWSHSNAYTTSAFGPLTSPDGSVFGAIHTGLGDPANTGLLSKQFNLSVPLDLNIDFQYNFVTNEYPVFVGSIYNDSFTSELHTPDGSTINLAGETVNSSSFTSVSGLPTDVLDFSTGGETGWKTISTTVSTPAGTSELHFHVKDVGDNVYDSATLIDNVSVK